VILQSLFNMLSYSRYIKLLMFLSLL